MYVEALIDCSKHLVEAGDNDDLDQPFAPPLRNRAGLQLVWHDLPRRGLGQDLLHEIVGLRQGIGFAGRDTINERG